MEDGEDNDFELFDEDDEPPPMPTLAPQEEKHSEEQKQELPEDFAKVIEEKVRTAIPKWSAEPPTICEVPEDLAEGNKGAYIPKVVCIGLLFNRKRGTPSMLRLERYKWCCVRKLIMGRLPVTAETLDPAAWSEEHALLLRKCLDKMLSLLPRIRASYSSVNNSINDGSSSISPFKDDINNNVIAGVDDDEQVARNMLLDGCFILHRLLKSAAKVGGDDVDEWSLAFGRCWLWGTVKRDLLLLSNQVPFFVVRELFNHFADDGACEDILVQGALRLFSSLHPRPMQQACVPKACQGVHHLLHLLYLSIDLPAQDDRDLQEQEGLLLPSSERTRWVPCAKELEEAGVSFNPRKRGAKSFLDVRFRGGALEIPPLQLFDYSEPLFRNLMAFEQTYQSTPGNFTAYAIFMDSLIKTAADVRLLHQSGVLVNHMNGDRDDTARGFFSRLCAEAHTSPDRNYLAGVMEEVVKYHSAKWPRWRAALVSNYFTNPWVTTSVVAAAFLLALTVLQSYYTVYGYYKPSK